MPKFHRDALEREVIDELVDEIIRDYVQDIETVVDQDETLLDFERSAFKTIRKKDFINTHKEFLETQAKSIIDIYIDGTLQVLIQTRYHAFNTYMDELKGIINAEI